MRFSEEGFLAAYQFNNLNPFLIDVGAHHGVVALKFARKGWRVIAFEPEQKNRAAFERNLANFEKVSCIPKAVSNIAGDKVPFYVSNEHYGIHSLKPWHKTHKLAYEVETVRLEDILTEKQVPEVTLLKIDIEGADFLALKGFDFGKYHPELVMIEFMDERTQPNFGYTHHDVVDYMKERGYSTFVSEWEPIQEYGRESVAGASHTWIQCVPYPLSHKPAWGNLIFVPEEDTEKFQATLETYLKQLKEQQQSIWWRSRIKKIPGAKIIYSLIKGK